jgi:hypothetical protein
MRRLLSSLPPMQRQKRDAADAPLPHVMFSRNVCPVALSLSVLRAHRQTGRCVFLHTSG